jgi:hypothetical protein
MCEIGSCGAASNGLLIKPRFVAAHDGRGVLLFTPIAPRKSIKKRDRESCDRTPTILIKAGDREALDMWAKAMRSRAAHEDDAADRANEPQAPGPKSVDAAKRKQISSCRQLAHPRHRLRTESEGSEKIKGIYALAAFSLSRPRTDRSSLHRTQPHTSFNAASLALQL